MVGLLITVIVAVIVIFLSRWPKAIDKNYTGFKRKKTKIDVNKISILG